MTIVPIDTVQIAEGCEPSEYEIKKVGPYLEVSGLIEPLKLDEQGQIGTVDPWDAARLVWCRRQGWATVIVAKGD